MAYQSGRYNPNPNAGGDLQSLSNALAQFGGVMNDREQIKIQQEKQRIAELEEEELKQAVEIFEGNKGKDIKNEHQFATKVGNEKYQQLKAIDTINNNYQTILEQGAKEGWDNIRKSEEFTKLNDSILADKSYNSVFKTQYANQTLKYEELLKDEANKEKVGALNNAFVEENLKSFVSGMKTLGGQGESIVNEHLNLIKDKVGDKYNDYVVNAISIMNEQGKEIPEEYKSHFAELADGNLEIAAAYNKNLQLTTKTKYVNTALLQEKKDKAVREGNIKEARISFEALKQAAKNKTELNNIEEEQTRFELRYSEGINANRLMNEAIRGTSTHKKISDKDYREANKKLLTDRMNGFDDDALLTKDDFIETLETQSFNGVDWVNAEPSVYEDAAFFREVTGRYPKDLVDAFNTKGKSFNFNDLNEASKIISLTNSDSLFTGEVDNASLMNVLLYKGMKESGLTNEEIKAAMDDKRKSLANGRNIRDLDSKAKRELNNEIESAMLSISDDATGFWFWEGVDSEDLRRMDTESGGVISRIKTEIAEFSFYTGLNPKEATQKMFTPEYFSSMFAQHNGEWVYLGADNIGIQETNQKILSEQLPSYVLDTLFTGGVSGGVAKGELDTKNWNIPYQLKQAIEDGDYDEHLIVKSTTNTQKNGVLQVWFKDPDTDTLIPINNNKTGEPLTVLINTPKAVKKSIVDRNNGLETTMSEQAVDAFNSMSLENRARFDKSTKPAQLPKNTVKKAKPYHEMISQYQQLGNTNYYQNRIKKQVVKKDKAETNSFFDQEDITNMNRTIQSYISKGNHFLKNASYEARLAFTELKQKGFELYEDKLKNGDFSEVFEKYADWGENKKLNEKLQKQSTSKTGADMQKHQQTEYALEYTDKVSDAARWVINRINARKKDGSKVEFNALCQDRILQGLDMISSIESDVGRLMHNTQGSSATGYFQVMIANGKKGDQWNGSTAQVAINRLRANGGEDLITDEIEEIDALGKKLKGKTFNDPEYKAFAKKYAAMSVEAQAILALSNLENGKGTDKAFTEMCSITDRNDAVKQSYVDLYSAHHTNAGKKEMNLIDGRRQAYNTYVKR